MLGTETFRRSGAREIACPFTGERLVALPALYPDVAAIEEALRVNGGQVPSHAGRTFDQILAPVRKGWKESGLSDDQIDQLFDDTLKKVRAEERKSSQ